MVNLKDMTLVELEALIAAAKTEIGTRAQPSRQLVLYTHNCKGSSRHHLGKYKHWAKLVTAVDTSKTNGYAFSGEFLAVGAEHKVPVGSVIVEVCDGSITAFRAEADRFPMITQANTKSMSGLIETVAAQL